MRASWTRKHAVSEKFEDVSRWDEPAVRVGPRSAMILVLATVGGLVMFCWPLVTSVDPNNAQHVNDAPLIFMVVLPVLVLLVLAQLSEGGLDSKALALLGVLSAVNAALRPLGGGTAGVESVFFLLIIAGRVFGPGFGFLMGCTSLFASALLTAGIGPWLPFQMLTSAWIGLGAGLLPRQPRGRLEIVMLAFYGVLAAYIFGVLMNLWFWPFIAGVTVEGMSGELSYIPGAPLFENFQRFLIFTLLTSTGGWDTGRAITNMICITIFGPALLSVFRRANRKASFGQNIEFN